jgi:hypothetical protein
MQQDLMHWIDKEVERLDREMKGKAVDIDLPPVPEVLKDVLGDCN